MSRLRFPFAARDLTRTALFLGLLIAKKGKIQNSAGSVSVLLRGVNDQRCCGMPCASSDVLLPKGCSHSIALKGRMVTNTLGEIRKRADLCDSKGAMLKVDIENEATEGERGHRACLSCSGPACCEIRLESVEASA